MTLHSYTMAPAVSVDNFSEHAAPIWMRISSYDFKLNGGKGGCTKGTNAGAKNAFSRRIQYYVDGRLVLDRDTMSMVAAELKTSIKTIRNCVKNKKPFRGGYFVDLGRATIPSDTTER